MLPEIAYRSAQEGSDDAIEVSFMVPCLNEEANVVGTLETIMSALVRVGCSYEILVFDDGSQDNTAAVVAAFQAAHPQAPIRLYPEQGQSRACLQLRRGGVSRPRHVIIARCPATTSSRRNQSSRSSARVATADVIVPHFVEIRNRPFRRTVISKLYTHLVNLASGYRLAYYNGNPLYRRSHVMRFHVECSGFGYQAEFLTRLISEGATFREIPLIAYDREGSAAMSLRNLLSVTHSLITIALRRLRIILFE